MISSYIDIKLVLLEILWGVKMTPLPQEKLPLKSLVLQGLEKRDPKFWL